MTDYEMQKNKRYFTTKYDDGGIYRENEYWRLRLAWKPKILLKEFFNIRRNEWWEDDVIALDTAKKIFEFILSAFDNIGRTIDKDLWHPLSPFVFYPNKRKNIRKFLNINQQKDDSKNN